jgi:hypothetical protein
MQPTTISPFATDFSFRLKTDFSETFCATGRLISNTSMAADNQRGPTLDNPNDTEPAWSEPWISFSFFCL